MCRIVFIFSTNLVECMPKIKPALFITILLFILLNTTYYWEGQLGIWAIPAFSLVIICFVALAIHMIFQIYLAIKEKRKNTERLYIIIIMAVLLSLIVFRPYGLVDFDKLEGKDLLIANRKGVASCTITLKLKTRNKFYLQEICFGIDKLEGTYEIQHDTIKFHYKADRMVKKRYDFATIEKLNTKDNNNITSYINLFKSAKDTTPMKLTIVMDRLKAL
ncbi:MAG: hypothetical protein JWR50_2919 [Mucilaginibacter sp.]|nr:hypothetical protein [Mucilaginibacter sp.]